MLGRGIWLALFPAYSRAIFPRLRPGSSGPPSRSPAAVKVSIAL